MGHESVCFCLKARQIDVIPNVYVDASGADGGIDSDEQATRWKIAAPAQARRWLKRTDGSYRFCVLKMK